MQVNHKLFLIEMKHVIFLNAATIIHFKKNSTMNYYCTLLYFKYITKAGQVTI